MKKLLVGLGIVTGVVLVLVVGFLVGSAWNRPAPDNSTDKQKAEVAELKPGDPPKKRSEIPDASPPTPPVKDKERIRESLQPGKTYQVGTELAFHMRGTDQKAFWSSTVTISYAAQAQIDRKIVANDGTTIVEERTFKKVQATKIDTNLDDFHIDLGPTGDFLLGGIALLQPDALFMATGAKQVIEHQNMSSLLKLTGLDKSLVASVVQKDENVMAWTSMGTLQGKTARLTYKNDLGGDIEVAAVNSTLSGEEQRFLASSVLLSDSLIFPDTEIKRGQTWETDSMYFIGLIDPSLMVRPEGKVQLVRGEDKPLPAATGQKEPCIQVSVVGGELTFQDSTRDVDQAGYFRPTVSNPSVSYLIFSPQDKIFIEASLKGKGKMTVTKNWLLGTVRSDAEPEISVHYTCKLMDGK